MSEHSIQTWVQTAVKQMSFLPDRDRVRQELWDHLLDSRDHRVERGMDIWAYDASGLSAMIAAETEVHASFGDWDDYESGYAMTLTFYDEAGNVTAVHESEGTYDEN